jgi:hypothetical protein
MIHEITLLLILAALSMSAAILFYIAEKTSYYKEVMARLES